MKNCIIKAFADLISLKIVQVVVHITLYQICHKAIESSMWQKFVPMLSSIILAHFSFYVVPGSCGYSCGKDTLLSNNLSNLRPVFSLFFQNLDLWSNILFSARNSLNSFNWCLLLQIILVQEQNIRRLSELVRHLQEQLKLCRSNNGTKNGTESPKAERVFDLSDTMF